MIGIGIGLADNITEETRTPALDILRTFSSSLPRAAAPRRLALTVAEGTYPPPSSLFHSHPLKTHLPACTGDDFKELVKPYLLSGLSKGIPSLFADVKALYKSEEKKRIIEEIVEELRESLSSTPPPPHSEEEEPPTTYLWALYFLSQHYSFISQPSKSLSLLDVALRHTPTLPELYTCKARVLKRAGDPLGAARSMESARLLDGQDRFLNTKCAKYRLRVGLIEEANEILGYFTKVGILII